MKITICSSMKNLREIKKTMELLKKEEITVFFPNIDFIPPKSGISTNQMRKLQNDHFSKIKDSDAIYVLAVNKYIGQMVGIEIGYAKGLHKRIIFSEKTNQIELDTLADDFLNTEKLIKKLKRTTA